MYPPPYLLYYALLLIMLSTCLVTHAQDSTQAAISDSLPVAKYPTKKKIILRSILPHWDTYKSRPEGPSTLGILIRVNPCTWVLYYSYEYVLRNIFVVPRRVSFWFFIYESLHGMIRGEVIKSRIVFATNSGCSSGAKCPQAGTKRAWPMQQTGYFWSFNLS